MEGRVMDDQMLTTVDNPFNPFHNFKEWLTWDMNAGYNTLGYLARIAVVSPDLSEADYSQAIDNAIDEIIEENVYGMHCRITPTDTAPRTPQEVAASA
jgi:hypothetical protein